MKRIGRLVKQEISIYMVLVMLGHDYCIYTWTQGREGRKECLLCGAVLWDCPAMQV